MPNLRERYEHNEAYERGMREYREGGAVYNNPYPKGSRERYAFNAGFIDAESDDNGNDS